ncbi:hybrid sensor histidine kinase/response regulator [Azospirillum isscasi]|uniref:histidine kinase n=1 Tax=Azospirillum isscasi TaxID=3053926 RepID=A0ABU0WB40_9PROT|nr:ATP-binding protein [Azospirillum isscasi]MDQ2101312.1 ATP-binding protein [Azospirillum isscasi]
MDRPDQELAELLANLGARLPAAPSGVPAHLREPLRALRDRLNAVLDAPLDHPQPEPGRGEGGAHFRALLSDAIGCVSEGFVLFGADGRLVLCNDRYRAAYPLLSDHLVPGVRFADLLRVAVERGAAGDALGDPSDWIAERLNRHIRNGPPTDHQLGDGRWYRISEHATRFGGVVKILTDITELKRHEEALADSEARYRRLVEMAPYGILIWDGLRVRFANRSAALILGSGDPEAMLRIPLVEATEFDGMQRLFDWLPPPGTGLEAPPPVEARFITAQGALRELEVGIHPFTVGAFTVEGEAAWLLVLNDITGRKQAERAIQQAQKMQAIGQLAGGIAHEFNNMLTAIGGFAQMARRAPQDRPRVEQCLTEIVKATDRASGLTAQLLSFGRPGRTDAVRPVRVGAVIEDLRRFLGPTLGERHPLRIEGAGGGAVVTIDPGLLHQSLVNLVLNARDAMPEGGAITIAVGRPDDLGVTVTVADTGCGIDPAVIDRIFEPFFTTKEPGAGTGLGLALVYSTVARAGGAVDVDTELGRGTVFTLRFPTDGAAALPEPDAPGLDDAFFPGAEEDEVDGLSMAATVLLVEDEAQVRDFIRLTLEDMGMRVVCATDGADALRAYADHGGAFDLLVTDLVMPQVGGASVARALRRENPDLPTVLMSGYPPETESLEDLLADPKSGGRRIVFLRKPINPDELADTIHALLV